MQSANGSLSSEIAKKDAMIVEMRKAPKLTIRTITVDRNSNSNPPSIQQSEQTQSCSTTTTTAEDEQQQNNEKEQRESRKRKAQEEEEADEEAGGVNKRSRRYFCLVYANSLFIDFILNSATTCLLKTLLFPLVLFRKSTIPHAVLPLPRLRSPKRNQISLRWAFLPFH